MGNWLSRWVQINIRWGGRVLLCDATGLYLRDSEAQPAPTRYYCFFPMIYLLVIGTNK